MRRRSLVAVVLLVLLAGCEASCSTAALSEPAIAAAVDPETQAPIAPASSFPAATGSLYATIRVASAPADTSIAALFFYLEGGEQQIASDEMVTGGNGYISFALNPPYTGWPVGRYEVRYLLNGEPAEALPFSIGEAGFAGAETPAPSADRVLSDPPMTDAVDPGRLVESLSGMAPPPATTWQRFADAELGFALEAPSDWGYRLLDSGSYIIEGPQGTEAYEISIIVQIIDRAANPDSSTMAQYQEGLAGATAIADAEIVEEGLRAIAGQRAPYFIARYTGRDSRGNEMPFGHLHFVLEGPRFWYWVSAIAPLDIFRDQQEAIDHAVTTFEVGP